MTVSKTTQSLHLKGLAALNAWMIPFAKQCMRQHIHCISLMGPMGSGKTTWAQSFLAAQGYTEAVQSPTFNLLQTHIIDGKTIHHFDLYRLDDPVDCVRLGLRDLCAEADCVLIEWPDKAGKHLPKIDLTVTLEAEGKPHHYQLEGPKALLDALHN